METFNETFNNTKFIFIINGAPESGKDTFIKCIKNYYKRGGVMNISSIDIVKDMLIPIIGDRKGQNERKLLSSVKSALIEYDDFPTKYLMEKLASFMIDDEMRMMFIHIREPKEIDKFIFQAKEIIYRYYKTNTEDEEELLLSSGDEPIAIIPARHDISISARFCLKTLYISRPASLKQKLCPYDNESDDNVADYKYDHYFDNIYKDKDSLAKAVRLWFDNIVEYYAYADLRKL